MFTASTNCGPLAKPRWSATTTMRGRSRAGDQAHMLRLAAADVDVFVIGVVQMFLTDNTGFAKLLTAANVHPSLRPCAAAYRPWPIGRT